MYLIFLHVYFRLCYVNILLPVLYCVVDVLQYHTYVSQIGLKLFYF